MKSSVMQQKVMRHYDLISPYYHKLWSEHIHHGYYITGKESRKEATENLIKHIISKITLKPGSKVLDVGCGVGGTSRWLAENYRCKVKGITISKTQIEIANALSKTLRKQVPKPEFLLMDAQKITLNEQFDVVWAIEMISHLEKRELLFKKSSEMLTSKGHMCIADWFEDENINGKRRNKYIRPIEEGMFVSLQPMSAYTKMLSNEGFTVIHSKDISQQVKKTWDLCLDIIKKPSLWNLALRHGPECVGFLKAFQAMRNGFSSGAFRYSIIIAQKQV